MTDSIDAIVVHWGDRLFYSGNRIVKGAPQPRLSGLAARHRASEIRRRIAATAKRAPQVMVKVTGGGRGMKAIAAHLRYISKNGRLEMEDECGRRAEGRQAVREVSEEWRYAGSLIPDSSHRREAYNLMLSMPRGTADGLTVLRAAREFAQAEFAEHKYVLVLHDHQANPHVHISVRAESRRGRRLNPRKADLMRWRETFAERLRSWGVDAEATRQAARGVTRNHPPIWAVKADGSRRLRGRKAADKAGRAAASTRLRAAEAWARLSMVLASSPHPGDRVLAEQCRQVGRDCYDSSRRLRQPDERNRSAQRSLNAVQRIEPKPLTR